MRRRWRFAYYGASFGSWEVVRWMMVGWGLSNGAEAEKSRSIKMELWHRQNWRQHVPQSRRQKENRKILRFMFSFMKYSQMIFIIWTGKFYNLWNFLHFCWIYDAARYTTYPLFPTFADYLHAVMSMLTPITFPPLHFWQTFPISWLQPFTTFKYHRPRFPFAPHLTSPHPRHERC